MKTHNGLFLNSLLLAILLLLPAYSPAKTLTATVIGRAIAYELTKGEPQETKPETAWETLQHSCTEYVEMYDRRKTGAFQAWLTTTNTEAMMAGYCQGSIAQYAKGTGCPEGTKLASQDYLELARRIVHPPVSIMHPRMTHSHSLDIEMDMYSNSNLRPFNEQDLLAWAVCNVE